MILHARPLETQIARESMRTNRFRQLAALITTVVITVAGIFLIADYRKTIELRRQIGSIVLGTTEREILATLGPPDSVAQGGRSDLESAELVSGYAVWTYCSRFDWDGQRSRWNDSSFFRYWLSRMNPTTNDDHDAVITLWIRDGRLAVIENAAIETLFGRSPMLSL